MILISNSCGRDKCNLKSNITWNTLYHFLETRVRYWVSSSHISLWDGQEEDNVADIVQETMMSTFQYTLEYSMGNKGEDIIPWSVLRLLSTVIAYKHYQDLRRRDAQFVCTRPLRLLPQGYIVSYQQVDPLQLTIDNALQEWCFARLGNEIAKIPAIPGTALLIDLANCMHLDTRPTHLLQRSLLEASIQLQDYRRPLPNNPIEHGRHKVLLHIACRQIMNQQEKLKEQENIEMIHCILESTFTSNDSGRDPLESDPELEALAEHLEATAPLAVIDPAFRKALQDKLLSTLAAHLPPEAVEEVRTDVLEIARIGDTKVISSKQKPIFMFNGLDRDSVEDDLELTALASYLETTAPLAMIDPAFKKMIQDELARTSAIYHPSEEIERVLEETEAHLVSLIRLNSRY